MRTASCPSCGAEVVFKAGSSVVAVCASCHSVIARTDRDFESIGKVAELVETGSPLALDVHGAFRKQPFTLVGRAQMRHQAGGLWDEWYAHFEDGRWGWIAEAQGRFYLTFALEGFDKPLPDFNAARPGTKIDSLPGFVVDERGTAHAESAAGEIPFRLVPGESYRYADLSGPKNDFATIDWSSTPAAVYAGFEVTLFDLGLADRSPPEREARRTKAATIGCPQCGGALELRAPDETQRVGCPYCGSLLACDKGNLRFLQKAKLPATPPKIPLGATGNVGESLVNEGPMWARESAAMTVIGYLVRSVTWEGQRFAWSEYLLYEPKVGFRWLIDSDGNWSWVRPLAAGEVKELGTAFRSFQEGTAAVDELSGEFYWEVKVGEKVKTLDRIAPPLMLSEEKSGDETNLSLSHGVPGEVVAKAFGLKDLPAPTKAGALAPNPVDGAMTPAFLILLVLLFVVTGAIWSHRSSRELLSKSFALPELAATDGTQVVFSDPITVDANEPLSLSFSTELARMNWVWIEGDFFREESGEVRPFSAAVEYYYGYDGGEYWSEGSLSRTVRMPALEPGQWTMRLEISRGDWNHAGQVDVRVREGVPNWIHPLIAAVLLALWPVASWIRSRAFETARWADADFTEAGARRSDDDGSSSSSSEDDDDDT